MDGSVFSPVGCFCICLTVFCCDVLNMLLVYIECTPFLWPSLIDAQFVRTKKEKKKSGQASKVSSQVTFLQ